MQTTKQQWLVLLLEGALARREQEEATHREQEWEEFFVGLLEMGQRLRTVAAPLRSGIPAPAVFAELATKWEHTPAWGDVDAERIAFDLSVYQAIGLVMTADLAAGIRFFCELPPPA